MSKTMGITDVLSVDQYETYKVASNKQKRWLQEFLRSGDSDKATLIAYPKQSKSARYTTAYRNRKLFDVSVEDLFRGCGIDELKIAQKVRELMDSDDPRSRIEGLKFACKMLKIVEENPCQKCEKYESKPSTFSDLVRNYEERKNEMKNPE